MDKRKWVEGVKLKEKQGETGNGGKWVLMLKEKETESEKVCERVGVKKDKIRTMERKIKMRGTD